MSSKTFNLKSKIGSILTVLAIGLFIWYFINNASDFKILLNINIYSVIALIFLYTVSIVSNGLFMKLSVSIFGKSINTYESVKVSLISSAGNFFAPSGSGLGFRAIYLKKKHKLSYSDYLSIVICNYIIAFFVSALVGLFAIYLLRDQYSDSLKLLTAFFVMLAALSFAAFFIRAGKFNANSDKTNHTTNKIRLILSQVSKGWSLVLSNTGVLLPLVAIIIFNVALMIIEVFIITLSLGISISFAGILMFSVLGSLSVFINITPGNLGVKEAVYILFSSTLGLSTPEVLSIALVDRAINFVVLSVLWLIFSKGINSKKSI